MANLVNTINTYPNRVDTDELVDIKNKFALRDRSNSDNSDALGRENRNPSVVFDRLTTPESLQKNTLRGLSYPLEIDGNGGLKISYGIERIGQAIKEVLETRVGERVVNPYMGVRELLFETISEDVEAQSILRQLLSAIPYLADDNLSVSLSLAEDGTCYVVVRYSVEGLKDVLVRYNYQL